MELTEMGLYLFFTCVFATLLHHPVSPIRHLLPNDIVRRACFGNFGWGNDCRHSSDAVGQTIGRAFQSRDDVHVLLAGQVRLWDAVFYGVAQFARV